MRAIRTRPATGGGRVVVDGKGRARHEPGVQVDLRSFQLHLADDSDGAFSDRGATSFKLFADTTYTSGDPRTLVSQSDLTPYYSTSYGSPMIVVPGRPEARSAAARPKAAKRRQLSGQSTPWLSP